MKKLLFILLVLIAVYEPTQAGGNTVSFGRSLHIQPENVSVGYFESINTPFIEHLIFIPVSFFYYNEGYKFFKKIMFIKRIFKPPRRFVN